MTVEVSVPYKEVKVIWRYLPKMVLISSVLKSKREGGNTCVLVGIT